MPIAVWVPPVEPPLPAARAAPIFTPVVSPAKWRFAVGPWNSLPNTELPTITTRSITWRLTGSHEATFVIDGTLPEAAAIQELISDLWVFRNKQALYRGRVGTTKDTVDQQSMSTEVTSASYSALLARRLLLDGDTLAYSLQDKSALAWALITQTQAKPAGDFGIVRGAGQTTGATQAATFQAGASVGDSISQISQADNGFEWDLNSATGVVAQTFDVYYPQRGNDRQKYVDYPGQISAFTRTPDPGTFANVLRVTGTDGLTPAIVTEPGIATDPAGRFEAQYGDLNILTAGQLSATAAFKLAASQLVVPSWTVTLTPDIWGGPSDVWLGDPVLLAVDYGRLNVLETLRVVEITVTLADDSDTATTSLTLGTPPPKNRWQLRHFDRRLTTLENR